MTQRRWTLWLAALAGVVVLRWIDPLTRGPAQDIAQPVAKNRASGADRGSPRSTIGVSSTAATLATSTGEVSAGWPLRPPSAPAASDLFPVRTPPAPPAPESPPPSPPPPAPPQVVEAPPPPPPPPLQVIGTWTHGQAPSVFLAGPHGTLQGRPGEVLLGEYRVEAIQPREVVLTHLPTQRTVTLVIPARAAGLGVPP